MCGKQFWKSRPWFHLKIVSSSIRGPSILSPISWPQERAGSRRRQKAFLPHFTCVYGTLRDPGRWSLAAGNFRVSRTMGNAIFLILNNCILTFYGLISFVVLFQLTSDIFFLENIEVMNASCTSKKKVRCRIKTKNQKTPLDRKSVV